jgi:pimeloyl-ACP methyl ester carboxylesterase
MYPAGVSGIGVRYVEVAPDLSVRVLESGPERNDAVLLVHGWGGSVYTFAEMIPALTAAGHRVIAFDLPGHGLSSKPADERKYTTRVLSDVILAVADAMDVRRFAFVGHSMGGSLGIDLAIRGEPRLNKLVLINSVGLAHVPILGLVTLLSPRFVNRLTPTLLTRRTVTGILYAAFGTPGRPTKRDIDEYWAPTQFDEFAWACRACVHHVNWRRTAATKLRSLRLPALVISGGRDRVVTGTAKRARLIPTARIVSMKQGGHLVLQECAAETNAEILGFLEGERRKAERGVKALS